MESSTRSLKRHEVVVLMLILLFGFVLRMAFVHEPFERDEGLYGYIGQEILRGAIPYRDVADLKPPGIFYIYAGIIALFGSTTEGIRIATAMFSLFSITAVFFLARYLYGSRAGLSAGLLFAIFSSAPLLQGSSSNTEVFLLLPLTVGAYLLMRGMDSGNRTVLAAGGCAMGAALVIKTVALPFLLVAAGFILLRPAGTVEVKRRVQELASFFGPVLAIGLVVLAYFAYHGALGEMYYWNVTIHKLYVNRDGGQFLKKLAETMDYLLEEQLLLWAGGVVGGAYLAVKRRNCKEIFLLLLLVASLVSVAMPGHFFNHYFIILTPFFAVAAGGALGQALEQRGMVKILALAAVAAGLGFHLKADYDCYFRYTAQEVSTFKYKSPTFASSVGIAQYIKERTAPDDYIIQWGFEQELLFLAQRRSLPNLHFFLGVEWAPDREEALREMLQGVNTKKPKYIILQKDNNFYVTRAYGFTELGELIQRDYYPELEQGWAVIYRRKSGA